MWLEKPKTERSNKLFFQRVRDSAVGRRVSSVLTYLFTNVFSSLGLLLWLGLVAAAVALYLFAGLAEEVLEGDTRYFDESALVLLNQFASPSLTSFMRAVTYLGSVAFLTGAGACVVLAFLLARWKREAIALPVTMAGAALLNFVLKLSFGRERPEPFFDTPLPESYSFPSGHALLSFCFYGVITAVITARVKGRWRCALVWIGASLLVALIGLSRIYLGVHYPSDVLAGYAAAFVWVSAIALGDKLLQQRAGSLAH